MLLEGPFSGTFVCPMQSALVMLIVHRGLDEMEQIHSNLPPSQEKKQGGEGKSTRISPLPRRRNKGGGVRKKIGWVGSSTLGMLSCARGNRGCEFHWVWSSREHRSRGTSFKCSVSSPLT